MIDLQSHRLIRLSQAARFLGEKGGDRPPHPSTAYRWAGSGVRADDGTVVVLETIRVGGRRYTSAEALQMFAELLTRGSKAPEQPTRGPGAEAARRASEECKARGL